MIFRRFRSVIAASFFVAQFVFAGGGGSVAGNGGDALVCEDGSVQFFDIFEAQSVYGFTLNFGPAELSYLEKVDFVLDRLPAPLEVLKIRLAGGFDLFKNRSVIGDFDLVDIPDADNIFIKPGCRVEQAVVQRQPLTPDEPIYYISKRIWDKMDEDSKAALVLHEIIYHEAILFGHTNSRVTRALNAYMMADNTPVDRSCLIGRAMLSSGLAPILREFRFKDLVIDATKAQINDSCLVEKGHVLRGSVKIGDQKIQPILAGSKWPFEWGVDNLSMRGPHQPQLIHFDQPIHVSIQGFEADLAPVRTMEWSHSKFWKLFVDHPALAQRPGFIYLSSEGRVLSAGVEKATVQLFGQKIQVKGEINYRNKGKRTESIYFAPTGSIFVNGQKILVTKIESVSSESDLYRVFVPPGQNYLIRSIHGEDINVDSQNPLALLSDGRAI